MGLKSCFIVIKRNRRAHMYRCLGRACAAHWQSGVRRPRSKVHIVALFCSFHVGGQSRISWFVLGLHWLSWVYKPNWLFTNFVAIKNFIFVLYKQSCTWKNGLLKWFYIKTFPFLNGFILFLLYFVWNYLIFFSAQITSCCN